MRETEAVGDFRLRPFLELGHLNRLAIAVGQRPDQFIEPGGAPTADLRLLVGASSAGSTSAGAAVEFTALRCRAA